MENVTSLKADNDQEHDVLDNIQTAISLNNPITEKYDKSYHSEKVDMEITKKIEKTNGSEEVLKGSNSVSSFASKIGALSQNICKSTSFTCTNVALKGFEFCHKHILEDKTSPYKCCNFIYKHNNERCSNPAPKMGDKKSFCITHDRQVDGEKTKPKKPKVKKPVQERKEKSVVAAQERPGSSNSFKKKRDSSSSEEEYNFFTDSVQVDKTVCAWLGNQDSDAESTDSEDENPLNHAGTWTVEECVRICREKVARLRYLYMQQFKRLSYSLKEERRKLLNEYDMDPYVLSKVGHFDKTGDIYADFVEDTHLTNYQKNSGEELLAEKMMREKRNHGHHNKKSDLPRCQHNVENVRCGFRVLPYSKFCFAHICLDADQHLFEVCRNSEEMPQNDDEVKKDILRKCQKPAELFQETCWWHGCLQPTSSTEKALLGFEIAKKSREARKRKQEQTAVTTKVEKKDEKKEPVYHNTRRASLKTKDDNLKSPPPIPPSVGEKPPKIVCTEVDHTKKDLQVETENITCQDDIKTEFVGEIIPSLNNTRREKLLGDVLKSTISDGAPKDTVCDDTAKDIKYDNAPKETISNDVSKDTISDVPKDTIFDDAPKVTTHDDSPKQTISDDSPKDTVIENKPIDTISEMRPRDIYCTVPKITMSSEKSTTLLSPELAGNITLPCSASNEMNHENNAAVKNHESKEMMEPVQSVAAENTKETSLDISTSG